MYYRYGDKAVVTLVAVCENHPSYIVHMMFASNGETFVAWSKTDILLMDFRTRLTCRIPVALERLEYPIRAAVLLAELDTVEGRESARFRAPYSMSSIK